MKHGTAGGFRSYRCTCAPCREANRLDIAARRQARRERRTLVDGRWVAPVPASMHGSANTYGEWLCRCPDCTSAQRERSALARQRARERDRLHGGGAPGRRWAVQHGTDSSYTNRRCRCGPCRAAHSAYIRSQRHRRYAARTVVDGRLVAPDHVQHGTSSAYLNWGCRCRPCTTANSGARQEQRIRSGSQQ